MTIETTKKALTHQDLKQFTGDLDRFRHPFKRNVIFTPGVEYLVKNASCWWLIDAIASYFGSKLMNEAIERDDRLQWLQFWRLDVCEDSSAVLTARADSDEEPFVRQLIPFTDFPLTWVNIWAGFDEQYWTLYLPSEH